MQMVPARGGLESVADVMPAACTNMKICFASILISSREVVFDFVVSFTFE
jgi:hypothetical protein